MITINQLSKKYNDFVAVDQVTLQINAGEIFGLLGPNGAGKTSILECLSGIRHPDGGTLTVAGVNPTTNPHHLRQVLGVQLQSAGLPEVMTPREAVRFFAAYQQISPRYDLLTRFDLTAKQDTPYHQLSTGQKRRLHLALAMGHQPDVLILDEPTAGLDVASRQALHQLMRELKANGCTIILATHDMAEAEEMADRVAILLQGKIVKVGTPLEITATGEGLTKISVKTRDNQFANGRFSLPATTTAHEKDGYVIFFSTAIGPTIAALIQTIQETHDELFDLRVERPSLEDRFRQLTDTENLSQRSTNN